MFANSSQEYGLSNENNFDESGHLSQGTQSCQKPAENYQQLSSNNNKDNNISPGKSERVGFLRPENLNSHAPAAIEADRNNGLMWFTVDNNVQNTNEKEKNSPWQGSGVPVNDRNSSDEILPTKTTNVKISKLDKREAKTNWEKDNFWRKSKDALKKIKPQRRHKPYKDLVRSGSTLSQEYELKGGDMYHLEVPLQYQGVGDNISSADRMKMEKKILSKDDSSTTRSQDSIIGKLRRTLVSLFGGSKHSPSMEDVMKVDDAVVLSFPQSSLSTLFSSSKTIHAQQPNLIQSPNNSHSLATGILHEYPRTPPFAQDEPSSGNLLAFRTNPHTNFRKSHSITRRSRDSQSDEGYEGFQFSSNEPTEDYNYDSLNYSNDNVQSQFYEFYDSEEFTGNKEESQSNPHSFRMESQSTPILLKITRESENKNYDLFSGPNVNLSSNKNSDSMDYRSPRFVANLNDDSRKFSSNKLSKTGNTKNYNSPKVLLYIRNDKPATISHGSGVSSSTQEIVQQLYKTLLSLHESASLNKDITAQSSRSLKRNPQYASPQKFATGSYKNHPSSGSYRTASQNGNTHSGPPTQNTQSSIDRSKKILHLSSQLSLIIEDEETSLKNMHKGIDSQSHLSQISPRVITHNQEPSSLDNSLMHKLDERNTNVKPQEEDRSSSFTIPIPIEYPQQREKFPERSANLWRISQEHKRGKDLTRREMYDMEETPADFRQATLNGIQPYENKRKYDKWGSLESYYRSKSSGYKPGTDEKRFQTNHRDSIKSADTYNHRRAFSSYNKPKPDTIISKSSGDVSIKVRLPSDVYRNEVQEPLPSNTESKYKHYSAPNLKRQSKPFDNQYSYRAKHYEQSSEEDDDEKITASDLNFEDIFAVVKHGFRTVKFYWDMIKKGWPILLDDS